MRHCEDKNLIRSRISWNFWSGKVTVPASMSTVHTGNYLIQVHHDSPTCIFLTLTDYFALSGKEGNNHLSALAVISNTWFWSSGPPFTAVMMS